MQYTDIDNTGLPAVPDLRTESNDEDTQYEELSEYVWSHRQETEQPREPRST